MAGWHERKAKGDDHERDVKDLLEQLGWEVQLCGQGTFLPLIREALRHTDSGLRQFPDMLAARGRDIVAIDAKTRMESTGTGNYAVSRTCLQAGLQMTSSLAPVRLFYVFGDYRVLTPAEVMAYSCHAQLHTSGSYHLVDTRYAHRFDDVFGPRALLHSA